MKYSGFFKLVIVLFNLSSSWGQVTVDGTLGKTPTDLSGPDYRITHDLGAIRGTNLFHSFQEFNLMANESAIFGGPASIENIMARVTGGNQSEIDGLIQSEIIGANLFLMNPSGVILGPNSQIDVSGSFTVTSADQIKLDDSGSFNALNPQDSVLTSAPPTAFGFLKSDPSRLEIRNNMLKVRENSSFSIIGGGITFESGDLSVDGGKLNVVSLGGPGEVAYTDNEEIGLHNTGPSESFENTVLFNGTDVIASDGGRIIIEGHNLDLTGASVTSKTTGDIHGGDIDISLTGDLTMTTGSRVATITENSANGGAIRIKANQVVLESKFFLTSKIESVTSGIGVGGLVDINALDQVMLEGEFFTPAEIRSDTHSNQGDGGTIRIKTGILKGVGDIRIESTSGLLGGMGGIGGDISISASQHILLEGKEEEDFGIASAQIKSTVSSGVSGGNIDISTPQLSLGTASFMRSETNGTGLGGNIFIRTVEDGLADSPGAITLDGTLSTRSAIGIFTNTSGSESSSGGHGGNISIRTKNLEILSGAQIKADSTFENAGDGGNVEIIELDKIRIDGKDGRPGTLLAAQSINSPGEAGTVTVQAKRLEVLNGGQILANSTGTGKAGGIKLDITENLLVDNGDVLNDSLTTIGASQQANQGTSGSIIINEPPDGNLGEVKILNGAQINSNAVSGSEGGNITLNVKKLEIVDSKITASTRGEDAGTISITADEILLNREHNIDSGLSVRTESGSTGNGGSLIVNTGSLTLNNGAEITSESKGRGDAGSIDIMARHGINIENSGIVAEASSGNGGNISIRSNNSIIVRPFGKITAKAGLDGGNIDLKAAQGIILFNGEMAGDAAKNGGNITMEANTIVFNSSRIVASAIDENGGNIRLMTKGFLASSDSIIDASSEFGVSGSIEVAAPDIDVAGSLAILPESFFSSKIQLQDSCAEKLSGDVSSFIAVGRGGVPIEPGGIIQDLGLDRK